MAQPDSIVPTRAMAWTYARAACSGMPSAASASHPVTSTGTEVA